MFTNATDEALKVVRPVRYFTGNTSFNLTDRLKNQRRSNENFLVSRPYFEKLFARFENDNFRKTIKNFR